MAPLSKHHAHLSQLARANTGPIDCALTGTALLNCPYLNKGSAFTPEERRTFKLTGLLPTSVHTLDTQCRRAYEQFAVRTDDLARNTFLASLKDQNEVLYYRLLQDHIKEMLGVIYTPTEALAIQNYSKIFRRPQGCFLNINDKDRVYHDLSVWGEPDDLDYIVVTDAEEILGIGDQGVGGILISIAKLALCTLCSGIHPGRCLPVVLDCGTNNQDLLDDELYLGLRQRRATGKQYDDFVDTFVQSARKLYPRAYIHFEDFGRDNARRLLEVYRPKIACFNDDVQGTGCVTLAAIMAALHVSKQKLGDLRTVIFGAGTAGVGIADQIRDAIATEGNISQEEATKQIWLIDKDGLLTTETEISGNQKDYVKDASAWKSKDTSLLSVVKVVRPNLLVGTSTVPGAFTEEVVQAMHAHTPRPLIFPLSNPTRLHEAKPADLLRWTSGQALVATGSPFDPVTGPWGVNGEDVAIDVAECNNSVVFPGIGLGCVLSRAKLLTDRMLVAAVHGVASLSPALHTANAPLLPDVENVRTVSLRVARCVIQAAVEEGMATAPGIPSDEGELETWIEQQMWKPEYRPLRFSEKGRDALRGAR